MKKLLYTILFSAGIPFAQGISDTVSFVDFENREAGVYGNAQAKEDFKRNDYDTFARLPHQRQPNRAEKSPLRFLSLAVNSNSRRYT